MKIFYNLLIIIFLPLIFATRGYEPSNENITFNTENYCNERYDFCIDYPSNILVKEEKGDNSDGILLNNKAEKVVVNVYGTFNVFNENIDELFETAIIELAIKPSEVEMGRVLLEDNAYEFTIQTEGAWFYQKVVLYSDAFITTFIKAPKENKTIVLKLKEELRLEIKL